MAGKRKSFSKLQHLNSKYYKLGAAYFYLHEYRRGFAQLTKWYRVPVSNVELDDMFRHYEQKHFPEASDASSNISVELSEQQIGLAEESAIAPVGSPISAFNSESSFLGQLYAQEADYGPTEYFTRTQDTCTRLYDVAEYAAGLGTVRFSDFSTEKLRIADYMG